MKDLFDNINKKNPKLLHKFFNNNVIILYNETIF